MKEKIKVQAHHIWSKLTLNYQTWKKNNFIQSSTFIYWIAIILVSFDLANHVGRIMTPKWLGYAIVVAVGIILGLIVKLIISWIITLFLKDRTGEFIAALAIMAVTISGVSFAAFRLNHIKVLVIGGIIGALVILFLKSLWSVVGGLKTKFNIGVIIIGSLFIGMGVWLFTSKGFEDTYIKAYLQLEKKSPTLTQTEAESFEQSIVGGPYTPCLVTYDLQDASLISKTIDLTNYAQNQGFAGYIKERYQGYDLDKVPLRGQVWYPEEVKKCPTLFIIHGNHDYTEESYLGYEYLGRYLASYGYAMISIDENACNLLTNENDARAILLLENIKLLLSYNADDKTTLYEKIDQENLAIAGHSRGGEAVSIAYLFNQLEVMPNNGMLRLNYHFNIKSVIAIAPTIDQYKPTNKSVALEDVNYMIIHGANDQDLYEFGGMKQYKNIHFTGKGDYIKTSLYCAGCNHGQFNSRWGLYDLEGVTQHLLNVKNFVSEQEQQRIAEIFIKIFLDCTLKGDRRHKALLEDYRKYEAYLPQTLYVQSYQTSNFKAICNFEEDTSLVTGTMEGVTLNVQNGDIWTEGLYPVEAVESNSALYVEWTNNRKPHIIITLPEGEIRGAYLQLDLMNLQEGFKEEDATLLQGMIIVTDGKGNSGVVNLEDYGTVYPAFLVRLNKLQYLLNQVEYKHQFQTVTIPMTAFKASNQALNLNDVVELQIKLTDSKGKIAIDEIGMS